MVDRISKDAWIKAARTALLSGGVEAVRVEPLAKSLGVTKGSFYWHFTDRSALLEALLSEWEAEAALLVAAVNAPAGEGLRQLADELSQNVILSERGETPSDAAIFGWAAISPEVAERVRAAEEKRIALLASLIGGLEAAELFYMAYLGFILRRRHSDNAQELLRLILDTVVAQAPAATATAPVS
jgi:AcrR family transcriptional regulator